jgi:para-nitrobenzyl esterase
MAPIGLVFVCAAAAATASPAMPSATTVQIESGRLEGALADGVLAWKGIPFAAPPVGALRWRAPAAARPWSGVRRATAFGPDCMQVPEKGAPPPSEDCLFLNVWRPASAGAGAGGGLPVLVWIHGGAYVSGSGSTPVNDGAAFARQGLVFVSLNYRLGRFGFFAHPALTAAKEGPRANYGYLDQIEALRWVRRNIGAFGGDPAKVTVFGESAGGASVLDLLVSPLARGLFRAGIVLSGGGRAALLGGRHLGRGTAKEPSAEEVGVRFARSAGIAGQGPAALAALRALPAETVRGGLDMMSLVRAEGPLTYAGGPVIDGEIVLAPIGERLRRGEATRVPVLIGTTSEDLGRFSSPRSKAALFAEFGPDAARARAAYDPGGRGKLAELSAAVGADMVMQEPARFVARQLTAAGSPAWLYRFGYVPEALRDRWRGAPHASEVPFAFDTLTLAYGGAASAGDRSVARAFNSYLASFARTGRPGGDGLPAWPPFDPARSDLMLFTRESGPVVVPDPWKARLDLVAGAAAAAPAR